MITLTKRQLREGLGGATDADISRFFGISAAAVSQWGEDEAIPERRALAAALKLPDVFGRLADTAANDDAPPVGDGPTRESTGASA